MLKFLKAYFNLSNNEQRGVIAMLLIVVILFLSPKFYAYFKPSAEIPKDNTALLASFYKKEKEETIANKKEKAKSTKVAINYFAFNPNTVSKNDLLQLGFSEKTAAIFINYRNKGGKFFKKEDVKRVYGVSDELYATILPYISIPKKEWKSDTKDFPKEKKEFKDSKPITKETISPQIININRADSASLRKIYGVGPTFAKRIIKYRDLLGGFTHKEQLLEVYGMKQESYDQIKEQITVDGSIKRINVNTSTWKELKKHPYISSGKATIISKYIETHGPISSLSALLNPSIFTKEEIKLLTPYLSTE